MNFGYTHQEDYEFMYGLLHNYYFYGTMKLEICYACLKFYERGREKIRQVSELWTTRNKSYYNYIVLYYYY